MRPEAKGDLYKLAGITQSWIKPPVLVNVSEQKKTILQRTKQIFPFKNKIIR
jgi:hypothetical protein